MIRLIFFLSILLLASFVGITLSKDPGYVLITFHKWSIETTLTVAILGIIIILYALHLLLKLLAKVITFPHALKNWIEKRRALRAQSKTRKGLIEFSEGYWKKAKNHLTEALPDTDTPLLNYLTAARAAQELGESQLRDDYLRQAQQSVPEAKIAIELTQAQLQLANKQFEQALATLKHLRDLNPKHPYVLKLLKYLYQEIADYQALREILPDLKANHVISKEEYQALEKETYLDELKHFIQHNKHENLITTKINTLPQSLKYDIDINLLYTQYLIQNERYEEAELLLRKLLKKHFDKRLVLLYGQIKQNKAQLKFVETLNKNYPNCPEVLITLAQLSKEANLWGKAKNYLEESLKLQPSKQAYLELGLLYEQLDEPEKAKEAFKNGLLMNG